MQHTKRARKGRTLLTAEQQAEHDAKILENFNERHPVGSVVWYWHTLKPGSEVTETTVTRPAALMPSGEPVTFVEGVRGCVSIWNITEPKEAQRAHVQFKQSRAAQ
ncbi:hypothetical protein C5Y96_05855 [Blastopirellula marina]|uniref:Uncharacterized protein n=1 Tax=Blastopirellula marina TaxID=124 RepID=A0A2S8G4L1_9BACT|nr:MULTISPECIES: hypothetical protein [Pirellulaceae]PQO39378.1 hypothetical protein C5Y96_05855 [Blastopirellula marina]RCS55686.1 hypothetical protein DTL36_05865 [Bremerella cremea]